ncbi:hypothetical protein I8748_24555 [Nostoc sp. CENA67]|uniref:Uncharacterized protein n=1 Tax=Amazonocrinis nigriterrae CENA67 TaxID=2794033 RepID=A0A8J7LAZ9_9NOST|nr:hypothetical protein [Amazonocrinis nigriterrae]MBH8565315.1 hypothetical protein [Amazonocrinis nigriterrae CENA67]
MELQQSKTKRRRGVVLTSIGLKRLQQAILDAEVTENQGDRWTIEQLSDRMNISAKTLNRLWSRSQGVDRKTLVLCFRAFDLELHAKDYTVVTSENIENEVFDSSSKSSKVEKVNSSPFSLTNSFVKKRHNLNNLSVGVS